MAKPAFSEKQVAIINYLRSNPGEVSAKDIAEVLGITPRSANGTITSLQNKKMVIRKEIEDGVKIILLTDMGATADLTAIVE